VGAQNRPTTGFDFKAAEGQLKATIPFHKSLHEAERQSDGTRGYGLPNPTALMAALPNPPPPPFTTQLEWTTYYSYCGWDAIVRATLLESTPALTSDKSLVFTISHFTVVDTIKSDAPFTPDQHLVAYRVGGEVEDAGEKLRIDTPDMAAFEPRKTYILILRRDKGASVRQYSIPQGLTIIVRNDKVYPISGRYAWLTGADEFPSGAAYADIRNTFTRVSTLKTCDAR